MRLAMILPLFVDDESLLNMAIFHDVLSTAECFHAVKLLVSIPIEYFAYWQSRF